MPEKDGSEDKKSTKSVVNKKQKQFMNQEEQLDLSSVAESFGGRIVGEPVELDEAPALLAIPAVKYGIPAAIAVGTAGYDYYRKMKGKKGIFPDLSGVVKGVYDKIRGVHRSTTRTDQEDSSGTSGGTEQQRKYRNKRRRNLEGPDYSETSNRTGDLKSGRFKYNQNNKNKNNKFSKRDAAIGFGSGLGTSTAISTLTKTKQKGKGFRLGGLPGTAHNVGRRTNPQ